MEKMNELIYNARMNYNKARLDCKKDELIKSSVLSEYILKIQSEANISFNKAEHIAKACKEYQKFLLSIADKEKIMNDKYAELERLQYQFKENESESFHKYQENKLLKENSVD